MYGQGITHAYRLLIFLSIKDQCILAWKMTKFMHKPCFFTHKPCTSHAYFSVRDIMKTLLNIHKFTCMSFYLNKEIATLYVLHTLTLCQQTQSPVPIIYNFRNTLIYCSYQVHKYCGTSLRTSGVQLIKVNQTYLDVQYNYHNTVFGKSMQIHHVVFFKKKKEKDSWL